YNRGYKPYRFKGVKEYKDELGWYTMVNKKDVWAIDMVGRTSSERTGYATQKPEALLRQILDSCTEEGDLCADFFCGSGTLAATAQQMGRKWIACDAGRLAIAETEKRMWNLGAQFSMVEATPAGDVAESPVSVRKSTYGEGELMVEATVEQAGISDKKLLKVRLLDYVPPKAVYEMLDEKNTKAVKRLIKKDSLCLVNFWAVDRTPSEDGIVRPDQMIVRDKKGLTMEYEALGNSFGDENGEILVQVWDLFGGRASAKVKLHVIE
ncbi:MAG: site-specific DNA-methyltransferase, partial [Firmicutes bacterium]|nr:site-specific DNA-methyltransferase [Bacillota bacterium]